MTTPAEDLIDRLLCRVAARMPDAGVPCRDGLDVQLARRTLTLVYVEDAGPADAEQRRLARQVQSIALEHGGTPDALAGTGTLLLFDHATAGLDAALALQQADPEARLRIALTTTSCHLARFMHGGRPADTVLGAEGELLARMAQAAQGGIRISPSTYALVRDALQPAPAELRDAEPLPLELDYNLDTLEPPPRRVLPGRHREPSGPVPLEH